MLLNWFNCIFLNQSEFRHLYYPIKACRAFIQKKGEIVGASPPSISLHQLLKPPSDGGTKLKLVLPSKSKGIMEFKLDHKHRQIMLNVGNYTFKYRLFSTIYIKPQYSQKAVLYVLWIKKSFSGS